MLDKFFKFIEKLVPEKYRWILSHGGFKRYLANTGWMFFGQMFSLLVSFFIGAWLARYLGPENYGVLSYAIAFVGLFIFISSLGIDGILSRELVRFPEKRDELLGTAFRLKLIGSLIAFFLVVISALLFQASPLIKLLIILFSFSFILQTINVISTYFQAEVKSKNNVKALLFATIISSVLKVAVILLDKGVIWITIVYVLDSLWQGIGFVIAYKRGGLKIQNWCFNKNLAREILKSSWPLMLASAAGYIYLKIDQVMIGALLGNREVGLYAAAVKLVEVWYFIPSIICGSLFPAIINAKKTDSKMYGRRLKNLYILMVIISIIIAIPMTLLAKPIIYILFGSGYLESINILRIYIWSSLGLFLGTATYQYLMSENLVKTIFWLNFLAMIVNVVLNLIFIPTLGLSGAAWATLISCLVVPAGTWIVKKN
ncbi:MAG: flippase [Patescibacteria group bacterium]|jgi:O-antigen/teichoic acid export membrane protein